MLVHVELNKVMSDPKIRARLVELSAGERVFCAQHFAHDMGRTQETEICARLQRSDAVNERYS